MKTREKERETRRKKKWIRGESRIKVQLKYLLLLGPKYLLIKLNLLLNFL